MIQFFLIQNRNGQTRLEKWYTSHDTAKKHEIKKSVHLLVSNRDVHHVHFIDFEDKRLLYRRYAGLFFILCIDRDDNEFAALEIIHLFVEILDHYFGNVCELDLVFGFHRVYMIIDELFLAGEIQETSKARVLSRIDYLENQMQN
uniref:AP complex subunit sigma n=1 Tax=Paramoeba aestuarina TaxID=180227 RepID=A0A7S4UAI9_9EUKA|mmetsp:Transcript_39149/g.61967  ORF Transcript_39149/g.61967 Transcript_39149/m.61967 type:complete len:145 (+) Transcript_39149:37-471(+)